MKRERKMLAGMGKGWKGGAAAGLLGLWAAGADAQVMWQTTHTNNEGGGYNSGECALSSSSIKIRVQPAALDVEEDAEIAAVGGVSIGNDGKSLELVGTISLPEGSAITGALLWDGGKILQGNLLDRHAADSLYENLVDRNSKPPVRPRDPLIIEKAGNGSYRFRVYPVSLGFSRHLRIRYQLPPTQGAGGLVMPFKAAIASSFSGSTLQIPVEIVDGGRMPKVVFTLGSGVRTEMVLPRTRLMTPGELGEGGNAWDVWGNLTVVPGMTIQPVAAQRVLAVKTRFAAGLMQGQYLNLFATVSQDVLKALNIRSATSLMVTVRNAKKAYDLPMACEGGLAVGCGSIAFLGKSDQAWNDTLEWAAFDANGKQLAHAMVPATASSLDNDTDAAVLWAASGHRFSEKKEAPTGPVYGFIDEWASLLALPKDTVPPVLAAHYAENGVPRIVNISLKDVIPNYVEGQVANNADNPVTDPWAVPNPNVPVNPWPIVTGIAAKLGQFGDAKAWKLERAGTQLTIHIPGLAAGLAVEVQLYDLAGKRARAWAPRTVEGALNLSLADVRPGTYFLKVRIAGKMTSKRIVI